MWDVKEEPAQDSMSITCADPLGIPPGTFDKIVVLGCTATLSWRLGHREPKVKLSSTKTHQQDGVDPPISLLPMYILQYW